MTTSDHLLAGRILAYIYIGMELTVVPIFQSEITPEKARRFIVGTYQLSLGVGGLVVNGIARATGDLNSPAAFRIIYGLFYVVLATVACGIWFVPESPRWLAMKGRQEEALAPLTRFRKNKFSETEINDEMAKIDYGITREVEKGTFMEMLQNKQTTKRTLVVIFTNFFLQTTGSLFASVYGAYFIKQLAFINSFTITVSNSALQIVACILAMLMVDKLGRRNVIFIGGSIQTAGLFVMGGLGLVTNPNVAIKSAIVAMMVVMTFGFTIGWAPVSHIISAEVPSMRLRDNTYRTASIVNIATQFAVTFSMPYLLNAPYAALGSKVGLIFGSMCISSLVFLFFYVPECKGSKLEDIDLLFESKVPLRHFGRVRIDDALRERYAKPVDQGNDEDVNKTGMAVQVEHKA